MIKNAFKRVFNIWVMSGLTIVQGSISAYHHHDVIGFLVLLFLTIIMALIASIMIEIIRDDTKEE